ncbi:MAG: hypothetical protein ACYCZQ_05645 [Burkholderiales bacterium]
MKNTRQRPDIMKRKLLTLLASLPLLTACESDYYHAARLAGEARDKAYYDALSSEEKRLHESLKKKFRGIYGLVLRIDATSPKHGVTITNEKDQMVSAAATLGPENIDNQTYTDNSMPVPKTVRATWREGQFKSVYGGGWKDGNIIGDYTVPVAERIPDSILDYIRKNGGALRLKIRLKDDGILIGWDVEEWYTTQYGRGLRWVLPGGDFQEAEIFNGKVVRKGWYIDKSGQKIKTDW